MIGRKQPVIGHGCWQLRRRYARTENVEVENVNIAIHKT